MSNELEVRPKLNDTVEDLLKENAALRRELAGASERYKQLQRTYEHLSDTWMAFQAQARPRVRDVHRAEAMGEFVRKFLKLAGDDAPFALLQAVLDQPDGEP